MRSVEAFMLAGGRGSRMKELTVERQKCLLPIEGRPVVGHIMESLIAAFGSVDLKVGVSYKEEDVKNYIEKNKPNNVSVTYVPHAQGGDDFDAYYSVRELLHDQFISFPGDVIALPEAYQRVISLFDSGNGDLVTALSPSLNVVDTHAIGKLEGVEVVEYHWKPPERLEPDHLRDLTIFASDERLFDYLRMYPYPGRAFTNVVQHIARDHKALQAVRYESQWLHVGYPEDLLKQAPRK